MLALRQLWRGSCITRLACLTNAASTASAVATSISEASATAASQPSRPAWAVEQLAFMAKTRDLPKAKQKGKKGAPAGGAAAAGNDIAGSFDVSDTKRLMSKAVEHLQHELANIRTGRATPGMLDHLKVDVYGEKVPLKACGTVLVRDPQLLAVSVFDPTTIEAVQKAIRDSPLQLNPKAEGQEILVPIPRPTAETLQAMMKVCKAEAEQAKVSVRHARKLAMDEVKKVAATLSEDEKHRAEREVQQLTDEFTVEVERLFHEKEKSISLHSS